MSSSTSLLHHILLPSTTDLFHLYKTSPLLSNSKPLHLSFSPLSLSLKKKHSQLLTPLLVPHTSGWTQQEVDTQLTDGDGGDHQQQEEEEEEEVVAEGEQVIEGETGADTVTDADVVVAEGESEEEEVEEEGEYVEPPEEAKLYVGNLPFDVDSQKLAELFDQAGVVEVAEV